MTVSNKEFLKAQFAAHVALGDRSVSSDAAFIIDGHEELAMLIKSFPWPVLSTAGEIEIYMPNGQKAYQQQQLETALQGQVVITETVFGHAADAIAALAGKTFDATVLDGTPEAFTRGVRIRNCFFKFDPGERDHENRTQLTQFSGTLFYHFFGETVAGAVRAAGV